MMPEILSNLKSFDPKNTEHHTEEVVTGYINCMLACYRTIYKNRKNEGLWKIFHEDFEGFTFDIFKLGHRVAVRELREQLVMQGVWVKGPRGSMSYAKTLQDCLDETTPAEWTEETIKERHILIQSATTDSVARLSQNTSTQPFQQQVQPPLQPPQLSYHLNQPQPPPSVLPMQQTPRQPYQPYTQFPIPGRGDSGSTQAKLLTAQTITGRT